MLNCLSSGFLDADPEMGILDAGIYGLCSPDGGVRENNKSGGRKLSKNLVSAGDQLHMTPTGKSPEHKLHHLDLKGLACAHPSSARVY